MYLKKLELPEVVDKPPIKAVWIPLIVVDLIS